MSKRSTPPSPVSAILETAIAKWNLGTSLNRYQVMADWEAIAGPALAARSRPLRMQKDWLLVEVDHPAWIQEMNLLKNKILAKIEKQYPKAGIKRIRFLLKDGRNETF